MKPQRANQASLVASLLALFLAAVAAIAGAQTESPKAGAVWVLSIDGAIGPATSDYVVRAIDDAGANGASLVVIEMDTPGGLDASMRQIISAILSSRVPVATWVTPKGARAASAGTYILYASHIAAMAEATNLGAATPVQMGGTPEPPTLPDDQSQADGSVGMSAMEKKIINDAAAYIRGLAELRGRNAEWAESAVREGVSLSASEAVGNNVVDLIAASLDDLLASIEGKRVKLESGETTITAEGAPVYRADPDWRTELLATITNPNVVLILGLFGVYGILLEFYNPGSLVPGVVGVICLILAGYALQLLPVNYAGLALMLVGIAMMIGEAFAPSFGALGVGGVVAFTIGGIMLFDTDLPAFQIGIPLLAAIGVISALLVFATIHLALRIRHKAVTTGLNAIIGQPGEALTDISDNGQVRISGEIWSAIPATNDLIIKGSKIRVTAVDGMTLTVEPAETAQ